MAAEAVDPTMMMALVATKAEGLVIVTLIGTMTETEIAAVTEGTEASMTAIGRGHLLMAGEAESLQGTAVTEIEIATSRDHTVLLKMTEKTTDARAEEGQATETETGAADSEIAEGDSEIAERDSGTEAEGETLPTEVKEK